MSFDKQHSETPASQAHWFTTTHWTVVLSAGKGDSSRAEAALEQLCRTYWYPLYVYVRRQGRAPHDAQDLTQAFFARLLEKNSLAAAQQQRGKFRSFLLASLNNFLANEYDRANAAKRGGGQVPISLDDEMAEDRYGLEPVSHDSPEKIFQKRWATTLLEEAFGRLQTEYAAAGKTKLFEKLKPFLAEGAASGDYKELAVQLGMTPNAVGVTVHRLRQRYRELVRAEIAQTVASPDEIEQEMKYLLEVLGQ